MEKTFGELTINDGFYVFCKSNGNNFHLITGTLKRSEDKRNHIAVKDDDGEIIDLPCDESRFEDEHYIYTTNKMEYNKWQIPLWEKQIKVISDKIAAYQAERQELQEKINRAKLPTS